VEIPGADRTHPPPTHLKLLQSGRLPRNRDNGPQCRSFPETAFRKLLQEKNLVLTSAEKAGMIPEGEIEAVQPWNRHLSRPCFAEKPEITRKDSPSASA